jgi:hypothetical protein
MSETSVQTALPSGSATAIRDTGPSALKTPPRFDLGRLVWQALKSLASLRLTVVLFVLAMILVFFGTLAQIDNGIWTVVNAYFRSFLVWIPLKLVIQFGQVFLGFSRTWTLPDWVGFPFLGGFTIGGLLLVNLVAAHLVRFKVSWKRSGILILHGGLIVLMLGEIVTALFAIEGSMVIWEKSSSNFVFHNRYSELAIVETVKNDAGQKEDNVVVVPGSLLHERSDDPARPWWQRLARSVFGCPSPQFHDDSLPFDLEVVRYMVNSRTVPAGPNDTNPADAGYKEKIAEALPEVSGTAAKQTVEAPSVYLKLKGRDGKELGTYLFSVLVTPQPVTVDGKTYQVSLRPKRTYKPYSLFLHEFRFIRYPGTNTPKSYASTVQLKDPERNEDRELVISMNDPLRYRGDTFYQADFDHDREQYTVLQVVRNPGWLLPYISCGLVTLGMMVHFGISLLTFLQRRGL